MIAIRSPKRGTRSPLSLFVGLTVFVGLVFLGRLGYISVYKHQYYLAEARQQQYTSMEIQAQRGIIYAADTEKGEPVILAESVERYAVSATPKNVQDPDRLIPILARDLAVPEQELWEKLTYKGSTNWPTDQGNYLAPFKHGLTKEQVDAMAKEVDPTTAVNFDAAQGDIIYFSDGLFFVREYQRVYPEETLAAHLLGYVNFEGKGQYGFEEYHGRDLQGSSGNIAVERDSHGRLLNEVGSVAGRDGYSYILTIDRNIQFETEQLLKDGLEKYKAASGTIVVLEAKTGAILAMASNPTFDPNTFYDIARDQQSVFRNPAIASRFEFGSVFKPLVMGMAIDQGLTTPEEKASYPGSLKIGDYTVKNVLEKAYPNITMTEVLEFSVNTGMIGLANRLGSEKMRQYFADLGFGQKTGVELAGESTGYLIPLDKMKEIQRSTMSFGQGIDTTPIHLAAAYTAIANDGVMLQPRIIDSIIYPDGTKHKTEVKTVKTVYKPETARTIRDMMVSVVVYGHAKLANVRGYKIAGKTGTAQMPNPAGGYYTDRFRHSFISIAPADDPEFVVFATMENPDTPYAETSVTPLSGDLLKYLLNYYQIPPTNR